MSYSILLLYLAPHKPWIIFANRLHIRVNQAKLEQIFTLVGTDSENCESYDQFEKSHISYLIMDLSPITNPKSPKPKPQTPTPNLPRTYESNIKYMTLNLISNFVYSKHFWVLY